MKESPPTRELFFNVMMMMIAISYQTGRSRATLKSFSAYLVGSTTVRLFLLQEAGMK